MLVEGAAHRSLGGALAWAVRRDATSLSLIADSDTGLLARRATLALTGLPPTVEQVRQFLADPSPTSGKRGELVDRLASGDASIVAS